MRRQRALVRKWGGSAVTQSVFEAQWSAASYLTGSRRDLSATGADLNLVSATKPALAVAVEDNHIGKSKDGASHADSSVYGPQFIQMARRYGPALTSYVFNVSEGAHTCNAGTKAPANLQGALVCPVKALEEVITIRGGRLHPFNPSYRVTVDGVAFDGDAGEAIKRVLRASNSEFLWRSCCPKSGIGVTGLSEKDRIETFTGIVSKSKTAAMAIRRTIPRDVMEDPNKFPEFFERVGEHVNGPGYGVSASHSPVVAACYAYRQASTGDGQDEKLSQMNAISLDMLVKHTFSPTEILERSEHERCKNVKGGRNFNGRPYSASVVEKIYAQNERVINIPVPRLALWMLWFIARQGNGKLALTDACCTGLDPAIVKKHDDVLGDPVKEYVDAHFRYLVPCFLANQALCDEGRRKIIASEHTLLHAHEEVVQKMGLFSGRRHADLRRHSEAPCVTLPASEVWSAPEA